MIRIMGQVVSDWRFYSWEKRNTPITQVKVFFWNGMILTMSWDDFMLLSDDEGD